MTAPPRRAWTRPGPPLPDQLWLATLIAAFAVVAGCGGEAETGSGAGGGGRSAAAVLVAPVRVGPIQEDAVHVASIEAVERVELAAKLTGRVATMAARLGDPVSKGDLLATIDDADLRHQLAEATAAIGAAEAAVSAADIDLADTSRSLGRATRLADRSVISEAELDAMKSRHATAESTLARARAEVARARAHAATLRAQLSYTRILAPFDAAVAARHVDLGALVTAGTPLYTLIGTAGMIASFSVPERVLGSVTPAAPVAVWVDAYADRGFAFGGAVARVSPVVDTATRTVAVEADLLDPEGVLRAGMFARVRLRVGKKERALLVPRAALVREAGSDGGTAVFVVSGATARKVPVAVGMQNDEDVEVIGELAAGDLVIVEGQGALEDGAKVKVINAPDRDRPAPDASTGGTDGPGSASPADADSTGPKT